MLSDFLVDCGYSLFATGWIQFAAAFGLAFVIMIVYGRSFVRLMHKWQINGQPISENVPAEHRKKAGTPTMGCILVIISIIVSSLLFMPMNNGSYVGWVALASLLMFGTIGFVDDYKKITSQSTKKSNGNI